ncbi:MAG TPA: hypothetical protein VG057_19960, partial [Solirubrobacteraceae bacterium]|nr:hypothetical protein [Solirubrobacteraceae bacterium]
HPCTYPRNSLIKSPYRNLGQAYRSCEESLGGFVSRVLVGVERQAVSGLLIEACSVEPDPA